MRGAAGRPPRRAHDRLHRFAGCRSAHRQVGRAGAALVELPENLCRCVVLAGRGRVGDVEGRDLHALGDAVERFEHRAGLFGAQDGDLLLFVAGDWKMAVESLGALRLEIAAEDDIGIRRLAYTVDGGRAGGLARTLEDPLVGVKMRTFGGRFAVT